MKSKLRSIFELRSNAINRTIERLGTLVEAYAVMLIVTLCVYIPVSYTHLTLPTKRIV